METKYYYSKNLRLICKWDGNEENEIKASDMNGNPEWIGHLIGNYGSKQAFWDRLLTKEQFDDKIENWKKMNSPERKKELAKRQAEREAAIVADRTKAYEDLRGLHEVIPTTADNIGIVLRWLNTLNWGGWELPKMSIGYRCNQYDCDGKQASTMTLDEPIEYCGEMVKKFVVGAPHGHLNQYARI